MLCISARGVPAADYMPRSAIRTGFILKPLSFGVSEAATRGQRRRCEDDGGVVEVTLEDLVEPRNSTA
jgi:hypothetical protein